MIKQTLEEWRREAQERFGDKTADWKFRCSRCDNIQSAQDFVEVGVRPEEAIDIVYQECIGRHKTSSECNWAAFGFLGTFGKTI